MTDRSRQGDERQQVEVAFASLKQVFGIERTLAKVTAYTYGLYVNC